MGDSDIRTITVIGRPEPTITVIDGITHINFDPDGTVKRILAERAARLASLKQLIDLDKFAREFFAEDTPVNALLKTTRYTDEARESYVMARAEEYLNIHWNSAANSHRPGRFVVEELR